MYQTRSQRCDHRIVSISQPHVRPIIRGKAGKKVEFSAKLSVSLTDKRLAHIDHLGWESFHEGHDLPVQVECYKGRHGHYPEVIIVDTLYGSRANRKYLADRSIRFAGKSLGRPKKETNENCQHLRAEARRRRAECQERIPIFGQGKNGYRLNYIRARTKATSEAWIRSISLVMNLLVLAGTFFAPFKNTLSHSYSVVKDHFLYVNRLVRVFTSPVMTFGNMPRV
ncbi:MAG: transposase [Deltaproteobacteria bacterium]|nr:transposase [Candidatus Anaeroferrophillus wilburensis]MBN2889002.1 transposase [Deltaproteobacteria bacterium]